VNRAVHSSAPAGPKYIYIVIGPVDNGPTFKNSTKPAVRLHDDPVVRKIHFPPDRSVSGLAGE
jgi:hypothetical protein